MPKRRTTPEINRPLWSGKAVNASSGVVSNVGAQGDKVGEGPGIDIVPNGATKTIGLGGDLPLLYDADHNPVSEYGSIEAACAAAASGDAVELPPGTYAESFTIPAGVTVRGRGPATVISGAVTLGAGAALVDCTVRLDVDQAEDAVCIVPPSGDGEMAYAVNCDIAANNATGAGYAAQGACDHLTLYHCRVSAQSAGVDANPFGGAAGGGWPETTYAATQTLGIYTTNDSLAPGAADPTWAALNGGLSNTDIVSFCLDRSETPWDARMFCIDGTTGTLWRRTTGDWAPVLTSADARTGLSFSSGETLLSVITDPVSGYVYALCAKEGDGDKGVVRSTDHGDTWTYTTIGVAGYSYSYSNIDAYDGLVVFVRGVSSIAGPYHYYSVDHGVTWPTSIKDTTNSASPPNFVARIHPAAGDAWYSNIQSGASLYDLVRVTTAGTITHLMATSLRGPITHGGVWCDPLDAQHLLIAARLTATRIVETTDGGATADSETETSVGQMHEIADGCDEGYWVQGCSAPSATLGKAPVYVSTDGVTLTNKSGRTGPPRPIRTPCR